MSLAASLKAAVRLEWFPLFQTLRAYRLEHLRADVPASLTVALLVIPQGIAYAMIAGLPPVYGLYSSVVTTFFCALFNHSDLVICGPTNAISLMIASVWMTTGLLSVREDPVQVVTLLTLLVGVIQLAFGLLKVGNLSQFVSRGVMVGFLSGAGLLIAINQVPTFLGLQLPPAKHFLGQVWGMITRATELNPFATAVGAGTMLLVFLGERYFPRWPSALLAITMAAIVVYAFDLESFDVALIGEIPRGLPPVSLPKLQLTKIADLADNALAIAILGCIETLSIAKSLSLSTGRRNDNNRDFVALGVSHVTGSFFSCMPGCGSLTRSALNHQAGARTRMAAILSAVWVGAVLVALGPVARYIPKASLAGMLIVLGLRVIKWDEIQIALRATRSDAVVLLITFVCTLLLHLETAIYVGVISSLVLFLRKASAPHLVEYDLEGDNFREIANGSERSNPEISIIHVEGELFFGASELFEDEVRRLAKDPNIRVVILRLKRARHLDATAVMALKSLWQFLRDNNRLLVISGPSDEVMRVLRRSRILQFIGEDNIFPAEENLTAATRKALQRAQQFLGKEVKPEVRVFYEQTRAEQQGIKPGA
jgi:SulP family sulfate permease